MTKRPPAPLCPFCLYPVRFSADRSTITYRNEAGKLVAAHGDCYREAFKVEEWRKM